MLLKLKNNVGFDAELIEQKRDKGIILKIGIIDADLLNGGTRHPNLALLKMSGFCKGCNHEVTLIKKYEELGIASTLWLDEFIKYSPYDVLILSQVFKFTVVPDYITALIERGYIYYGGTGFFEINGPNLPARVEHHMPDYSLYLDYIEEETGGDPKKKKRDWDDYLSYSIGFTTRGCIRHCGFCVNRLSNGVVPWSPVSEFYDETRPRIYLWDDNILAASPVVVKKVFDDLNSTGKPFQFRQGMDIRLITPKKAMVLSSSHYYGDFIFAFDHYRMDDEKEKREVEHTLKGLEIWRKYTDKQTKLYVIVAYDGQDAEDIRGTFWRIKKLMDYGCLPYIMRYEKYNDSRYKSMYIQLARWCNQPNMFKKMTFREFCIRNEEYHQKTAKNPQNHCSCYQTMLDFERENPDIAKEYFDLRYDTERRKAFLLPEEERKA